MTSAERGIYAVQQLVAQSNDVGQRTSTDAYAHAQQNSHTRAAQLLIKIDRFTLGIMWLCLPDFILFSLEVYMMNFEACLLAGHFNKSPSRLAMM